MLPNRPPPPPRQPVPGELLFEFNAGDALWRCELRCVRDIGVQAQFFCRDEFRTGRLWPFREEAIAWARRERRSIEAASAFGG
jgi:hypothetical protein